MNTNNGKIVIAVDGSKPSQHAISFGFDLGKKLGTESVVLHVIQTAQKVGYWAFIDKHFEKELQKYAEHIKNEAQDIAGRVGVQVRVEMAEGIPYEEIVKYIEKESNVMMLIMGTHGHSLTEKRLVGSTTDRVVREIAKKGINVPVTLVPFE